MSSKPKRLFAFAMRAESHLIKRTLGLIMSKLTSVASSAASVGPVAATPSRTEAVVTGLVLAGFVVLAMIVVTGGEAAAAAEVDDCVLSSVKLSDKLGLSLDERVLSSDELVVSLDERVLSFDELVLSSVKLVLPSDELAEALFRSVVAGFE